MAVSFSLKAYCGNSIKRQLINNPQLTYNELCFTLHRMFKSILSPNLENLVLRYVDQDGDFICLESDDDVANALMLDSTLRVHVFDKQTLLLKESSAQQLDFRHLALSERHLHALIAYLSTLKDKLGVLIDALSRTPKPATQGTQPLSDADLTGLLRDLDLPALTHPTQGARAASPAGCAAEPRTEYAAAGAAEHTAGSVKPGARAPAPAGPTPSAAAAAAAAGAGPAPVAAYPAPPPTPPSYAAAPAVGPGYPASYTTAIAPAPAAPQAYARPQSYPQYPYAARPAYSAPLQPPPRPALAPSATSPHTAYPATAPAPADPYTAAYRPPTVYSEYPAASSMPAPSPSPSPRPTSSAPTGSTALPASALAPAQPAPYSHPSYYATPSYPKY